jgi:hypothetical protein
MNFFRSYGTSWQISRSPGSFDCIHFVQLAQGRPFLEAGGDVAKTLANVSFWEVNISWLTPYLYISQRHHQS